MTPRPTPRRGQLFALSQLLWVAACAGTSTAPPPVPPPGPGGQPQQQTPLGPATTTPPTATGTMRRLGNGVTALLRPHHRNDMAQIQVGILAGSDFGAPGLAELAAEVLVRGDDATTGRRNLEQSIHDLGGTLTIDVSPLSTWLTIRVPPTRWHEAQTMVKDALVAPAVARTQIERIREEFTTRRIKEIWTGADVEVTRAFLLGHHGTADYLATLLDRDASEVATFIARLYRPDSTIASLQVPGQPDQAFEKLEQGLGRWPAPTGVRETVPIETRRLQSGLYWAPNATPGYCRAMLVLPLPDLITPLAAEQFVMHACLTLDGIGGRLEQLQRERGLARIRWRPSVVQIGNTPALVLGTDTAPVDAVALWQIAQNARQSLLDVPPTTSELELAIRRARLTFRLLSQGTAHGGRTATALAMLQQTAQTFDQRIAALAAPKAFRGLRATMGYLKMPAAMIVIGGQPPAAVAGVETFELLPPGALERIVDPDPAAQAQAAAPWLVRVLEALGGSERLRGMHGYSSRGVLHSEVAPDTEEQIVWDDAAGKLTRERTVMATTIVTQIDGQSGHEQSDETRMPLSARELGRLRREMRRHPLSLMAAHARGKLEFRPIAQRTVADRDLMILEAIDSGFDRLRIHVDTASNLIRVVEAWETTAEGTFAHVRDTWSDYRSAGGLRTPFRRLTEIDDGQSRVETTYSEWQPAAAR